MTFNTINFINIALLAILIVPETLHFKRTVHNFKTRKQIPGWISILDLIGRLLCIILMVIPITKGIFGFSSMAKLFMYGIGSFALSALYLVVYYYYFKTSTKWLGLLVAIIPILVFFNVAFSLDYFLLAGCAFIYGFAHIFIAFLRIFKN